MNKSPSPLHCYNHHHPTYCIYRQARIERLKLAPHGALVAFNSQIPNLTPNPSPQITQRLKSALYDALAALAKHPALVGPLWERLLAAVVVHPSGPSPSRGGAGGGMGHPGQALRYDIAYQLGEVEVRLSACIRPTTAVGSAQPAIRKPPPALCLVVPQLKIALHALREQLRAQEYSKPMWSVPARVRVLNT